jgi:hypothetical protein
MSKSNERTFQNELIDVFAPNGLDCTFFKILRELSALCGETHSFITESFEKKKSVL